MVICLERGADCLYMVQLMPLHPKTPSSLASFRSRLVLPFQYRLSQVVLEKTPLNVCSSSSFSSVQLINFSTVTKREPSVSKAVSFTVHREATNDADKLQV